MMQKFMAIFIALTTSAAGFAQQPDCYRFKEGKFRINDARAGGVVIAERRGGYQTESMETLKATVRFKITWQSDCAYTLTLDKVIRNENKIPFPSNMQVKVNIVAVNDDHSYIQEASSSVTNGTYRSEVSAVR